jgi:hypothetical protein
MKRSIFTLLFLVQTVFVFAGKETFARASFENVKMYRQAGTSTDVVQALISTDEVVIVRRFNETWTIVTVNGALGYVLTSELALQKNKKSLAATRTSRKSAI